MSWGKNKPKKCAACKKVWFPSKANKTKCPKCGTEAKGKYGNKKVEHAGRTFDSRFEASLWSLLCLEERGGGISSLTHHPGTIFLGPARTQYRPDFRFVDANGETQYAEAKGFETPAWRLKLKLWRAVGPGALRIYKGSASSIKLVEVVVPKSGVCKTCGRGM